MGEVTFNLHVSMTKKEVLDEAKRVGLGKEAVEKIKLFFDEDVDQHISDKNELAVMNCIFDGTGKIKMPTERGNSYYNYEYKGKRIEDTLYREEDSDYAGSRYLGIHKLDKSGKYKKSTSLLDNNGDGVYDRKNGEKIKPKEKPAVTTFAEAKAGTMGYYNFETPITGVGVGATLKYKDFSATADISTGTATVGNLNVKQKLGASAPTYFDENTCAGFIVEGNLTGVIPHKDIINRNDVEQQWQYNDRDFRPMGYRADATIGFFMDSPKYGNFTWQLWGASVSKASTNIPGHDHTGNLEHTSLQSFYGKVTYNKDIGNGWNIE